MLERLHAAKSRDCATSDWQHTAGGGRDIPKGWTVRSIDHTLLPPLDLYSAFNVPPLPVEQRMTRTIRGTVGTCTAD